MDTAVTSGSGGNMKDFERSSLDFAKANTVPEAPTFQMDVGGGNTVGVFRDVGNKYGQNKDPVTGKLDAKYSADGKTMIDPGTPAEIVTWDSMKMILENPNRSALMTFETTLGLALARDRQPTGRMLADVLRRSFAETRLTGFGDSVYTDPNQVVEGYTFIYNQLYKNMLNALEGAQQTSDYDFIHKNNGWDYSPDSFKIKGIDKFKDSYYNLDMEDKKTSLKKTLKVLKLYGAYVQSIKGGLNADHNENKQSSNDIKNSIMEQLQ